MGTELGGRHKFVNFHACCRLRREYEGAINSLKKVQTRDVFKVLSKGLGSVITNVIINENHVAQREVLKAIN